MCTDIECEIPYILGGGHRIVIIHVHDTCTVHENMNMTHAHRSMDAAHTCDDTQLRQAHIRSAALPALLNMMLSLPNVFSATATI